MTYLATGLLLAGAAFLARRVALWFERGARTRQLDRRLDEWERSRAGLVRRGMARRGRVWLGTAGLAWRGLAGPGGARQGGQGKAWHGGAGPGEAGLGTAGRGRLGRARPGGAGLGAAWQGRQGTYRTLPSKCSRNAADAQNRNGSKTRGIAQ